MPQITPLVEDGNLLTVSLKEVQGGSCGSPKQNWPVPVLIRETWKDVRQKQMLKTALKLFYVQSKVSIPFLLQDSFGQRNIFWKLEVK